jgi:hypothetical protein
LVPDTSTSLSSITLAADVHLAGEQIVLEEQKQTNRFQNRMAEFTFRINFHKKQNIEVIPPLK